MIYAAVFWTVAGLRIRTAMEHGGAAWALCWPGLSFAVAGGAYAGLGPRVFGKQADGMLAVPNAVVLLPYLLYTWVLWHLWRLSSREPPFHELCSGITIGRRMLPGEFPPHLTAVIDMTSEFPETGPVRSRTAYRCLPTLDGRAPDGRALQAAALEIIARAASGGVYIHCANGRGRTGTLAAAVLMLSGKAETPAEAMAFIRARRPSVALKAVQVEALMELAARRDGAPGRLEGS